MWHYITSHHCVKCSDLDGDIAVPRLQNTPYQIVKRGHCSDTEVPAILVLYPTCLSLCHASISFSCCRDGLVLLAGLHALARADKQRSPFPSDGAIPSPGQWWHQPNCPIPGVCKIQEQGCAELVGHISPKRVGKSKSAGAAGHYSLLSKIKPLLASSGPSSRFQKAAVEEDSKKGKKKISASTTTHQWPSCSPVRGFAISQKSVTLGFLLVLATGDSKISLPATKPCLNETKPGEYNGQNTLVFCIVSTAHGISSSEQTCFL